MSLARLVYVMLLTVLLAACGGGDDGPVKGQGGSTSRSLQLTQYYLSVEMPEDSAVAVPVTRSGKFNVSAAGNPLAGAPVTNLTRNNFDAVVLVPDTNASDGYREVSTGIASFESYGNGVYRVDIDGVPQVNGIIFVTIGNVRMVFLTLQAGSRATPVDVNQLTTVANEHLLQTLIAQSGFGLVTVPVAVEIVNSTEVHLKELDASEEPDVVTFYRTDLEQSCPITDLNNPDPCGDENAATYSVGGSVSGLNGTLQLQLNESADLSVDSNGSFAFSTALEDGSNYLVTITAQPQGQLCTLQNGSGTIEVGDVTNISISCLNEIPVFNVGGSVSGLNGTLSLVLNDDEQLVLNADGSFRFETVLEEENSYSVSIGQQPAGQVCEVSNGTGTISGDAMDVVVSCADVVPLFTVGGSVAGLNGSVTLALSGAATESVTLNASGGFQFNAALLAGSPYAVAVTQQPTGQNCVVSNGNGTISGTVSNVTVNCSNISYQVGGSVSGLLGSVVLNLNAGESLTLSENGEFNFQSSIVQGGSYSVTVSQQPVGQTCAVSGGTGNINGANVSSISVNCASQTFAVGGSISGLVGTIELTLNDIELNAFSANGAFSFESSVPHGSTFTVAIAQQPVGQLCSIANASGTINGADVASIAVTCANQSYQVGGTVEGLLGSVSLLLNTEQDVVRVSANGRFAFESPVNQGNNYVVEIAEQPTGEVCTVSSGSGTISGADITSVQVSCVTQSYQLSGSVTGSLGAVELTLNGAEKITLDGDGAFAFETAILQGGTYSVVVSAQPVGQQCSVAGGAGTINGNNVTAILVTCASQSFSVGGAVSGLAGAVGISLNGAETLTFEADSSFVFTTAIVQGSPFAVTIAQQPVGQLCTVANGSGAINGADVTNIAVSCVTQSYHISGTVSGQTGSLSLALNGSEVVQITESSNFLFDTGILHGSAFEVTVNTNPSGQLCVVTNGSGVISGADVTNVLVTCQTQNHTIGGSVSGLTGNLGLSLNGSQSVSLTAEDSTFSFPAAIASGSEYTVSITQQPVGQICTLENATGTVADADIATVAASCMTQAYSVSGLASGLLGTVSLNLNGTETIAVGTSTAFAFDTLVEHNGEYSVTIAQQPTGQTCTVTNGTGTINAANVTNITVDCVSQTYSVGGSVAGLTGTLSLDLNDVETVDISADSNFSFTTAITQAGAYAVTVVQQPVGQVCTVANGTGEIDGASVTDVAVTCVSQTYSVGGSVTGLEGSVTLALNDDETTISVDGDGSFEFNSALADGSDYEVKIVETPVDQDCVLSNAQGTIAAASVSDVLVTCRTPTFGVSARVSGIVEGIELTLNGNEPLTVIRDGTYTFESSFPRSATFSVVVSATFYERCTVANASGDFSDGDATVVVQCEHYGSQLSAGGNHTCMLEDRYVGYCWGENSYGQLGDGSTVNRSFPDRISGSEGSVGLDTNYNHGCSVLGSGTVECWGDNDKGQLGDGTGKNSLVPTPVVGLQSVFAVSTGLNHSCAIVAGGSVQCWGGNEYGQLGDGSVVDSAVPVVVPDIKDAVAISAGWGFSCAVLGSGNVQCWGDNRLGQLGDDSQTSSAVPVQVAGLEDAVAIDSARHSCVERASGGVQCWGANFNGQLGDSSQNNSSVPVSVIGLNDTRAITVNALHSCALDSVGTVQCWGGNAFGQLGDGSTTNSAIPVAVARLGGVVVDVAAGYQHTCAMLENGVVQCWGADHQGQLGDAALIRSAYATPVNVSGFAGSMGASDLKSCGVLDSGEVACWGAALNNYVYDINQNTSTPKLVEGALDVNAIDLDSSHACALVGSNVQCWGSNSHGQLGDGNTSAAGSEKPVTVLDIDNASAVDIGELHSCALLTTGEVKCWGSNLAGQLGNGGQSGEQSVKPVIVDGITDAVGIAVGGDSSCALLSDGAIKCWGNNEWGQLGNGFTESTSTPINVLNIKGATQVSAGIYNTCAIVDGGAVQCWGYNSDKLGTTSVPVTIEGISTAVKLSTGQFNTCAILQNTTLKCWGYNEHGQLGNGSLTDSGIPVDAGLEGVTDVAVGSDHVCARILNGEILCWGNNDSGQLGDGRSLYSLVPVLVIFGQ